MFTFFKPKKKAISTELPKKLIESGNYNFILLNII